MPKVKAPPRYLPESYVPTGSTAYTVKAGDNWETIAKANGNLDPLWLIQYNFETRDFAEINWYLKYRLGCKKVTADGSNFMFSGGETIYVPIATTVGATIEPAAFFGYGIEISGDNDFRQSVIPVLNWIAASKTGKAVLAAIQRTGKTITIVPFVPKNASDCNASAGAENSADANPAGQLALGNDGKPLDDPGLSNSIRALLRLPLSPMEGTGRGSDVTVFFTPAMWMIGNAGPCASFHRLPGTTPSQVLMHELVHAYRQAAGRANLRPTIGSNAGYHNREEFLAIIISNMFATDPSNGTSKRVMRADHQDFKPLAPALSTSKGFMTTSSNRNHVIEIAREEPALAKDLRSVPSYFNPFAEVP